MAEAGLPAIKLIAVVIFFLAALLLVGQVFFGVIGQLQSAFPAPNATTIAGKIWVNFQNTISTAMNTATPLLLVGVGIIAIALVGVILRALLGGTF